MPLCFGGEKKNTWQLFSNYFNERTSGLQLGDNFSIFLLLYDLFMECELSV